MKFARLRFFLFRAFKAYFHTCNPKNYAHCGRHVELHGPLYLDPKKVWLDDYVRLQPEVQIIAHNGTVRIGRYTAVSLGTLIVPGSHTPTVGLPQFLSTTHINDKDGEIIIGEDCWIGAQSTILSHARIGRGCVVAAGAIVTKEVPPYAVVAGNPARIIASRFTIDQILAHEQALYPEEERMSREALTALFEKYYDGRKSIGTDVISAEDRERLTDAKRHWGMRP